MTVPEVSSIVVVVRDREPQDGAGPGDGYDSDVESGLDEVRIAKHLC